MARRTQVGELRPSQLLHTFGVGAIVDLPWISTMVMGLDDWDPLRAATVHEERLLAAVRRTLGDQVERLVAPPRPEDDRGRIAVDQPLVGVPVTAFPGYMRCPRCERTSNSRWRHWHPVSARQTAIWTNSGQFRFVKQPRNTGRASDRRG